MKITFKELREYLLKEMGRSQKSRPAVDITGADEESEKPKSIAKKFGRAAAKKDIESGLKDMEIDKELEKEHKLPENTQFIKEEFNPETNQFELNEIMLSFEDEMDRICEDEQKKLKVFPEEETSGRKFLNKFRSHHWGHHTQHNTGRKAR